MKTWLSCTVMMVAACGIGGVSSTEALAAESRQIALCVGVETYDPSVFAPLRYSEDDAQALAKTLTDLGYDVLLMTPGAENPRHKPNLPQKILQQLKTRAAGLTKADSLIVTLSGHGVQFKDDPVGPDGIKDSYFCPQDAALDDRTSLVSLREIYKLVAESGAGRKLVIVDACRNEVLSEKAKSRREIELDPAGLTPRAVPEGMLALFSCASQEKSFEDGDLGHGVFTYHILEYLRGEAEPNKYANQQATLDGLVFHAKGLTQSYVQKHLGRAQQPELVGRSTDWSLGKVDIGKVGPVAVIRNGRYYPGAIAFADEAHLLIGRSERVVLWNILNSNGVRETPPFTEGVQSISILGEQALLGFSSVGGVLSWNIRSGEVSQPFECVDRDSSVPGVAWMPDGQSAWAVSLFGKSAVQFDPKTGVKLRELNLENYLSNLPDKKGGGWIKEARFDRSGERLLFRYGDPTDGIIRERKLSLWLVSSLTGKVLQQFSVGKCGSVDLSPDGKRAAAVADEQFVIFDCATAEKLYSLNAKVSVARFAPDGRRVAIAHYADPDAVAPWITVLDASDGRELVKYEVPEAKGSISGLAFSPSGRLLAGSSPDYTVRVWRLPR